MLRTFDELGYRQEQRFHFELGLLKLVHLRRLLPIEELLSQLGAQPNPAASSRAPLRRPAPHTACPIGPQRSSPRAPRSVAAARPTRGDSVAACTPLSAARLRRPLESDTAPQVRTAGSAYRRAPAARRPQSKRRRRRPSRSTQPPRARPDRATADRLHAPCTRRTSRPIPTRRHASLRASARRRPRSRHRLRRATRPPAPEFLASLHRDALAAAAARPSIRLAARDADRHPRRRHAHRSRPRSRRPCCRRHQRRRRRSLRATLPRTPASQTRLLPGTARLPPHRKNAPHAAGSSSQGARASMVQAGAEALLRRDSNVIDLRDN